MIGSSSESRVSVHIETYKSVDCERKKDPFPGQSVKLAPVRSRFSNFFQLNFRNSLLCKVRQQKHAYLSRFFKTILTLSLKSEHCRFLFGSVVSFVRICNKT